MNVSKYSKEIATAINNFLVEDGWHFSFNEERGVFIFGLVLKGKLKKINYIVDIKDDEYLVYAVSPLGASEDDAKVMANMAEFICRANYGLKMGNFEFDFDDGEIRYKVHVPCNDITPTAEMIEKSIYCPARMFESYGEGIISIIFNGTSSKEAVEKCEKHSESELRSFLTELLNNEDSAAPEEDEMDAMITRLAARLGTTEDDESESSAENEESIEIHTDLFDKKGGTNT